MSRRLLAGGEGGGLGAWPVAGDFTAEWAGSLLFQTVKNLPAMQETWVQSLGWEDPLEKKEKAMAPHSSTLAWKIAWAEEPGRLQPMGSHD